MVLQDQKAVVTGAGRGIGRQIALHLARAGADVVLAARTRPELDQVAAEIRQLGRRALVVPTDVSVDEEVENLAQAALKEFGKIDIVINNAAAFGRGPVQELPVEVWDRVLSVNLRGVFLVTRAFLPQMIQRQEGAIVMISSTSGKRADPGGAAYCTSKFGLMGFAQSLLYDVRRYNIRVIVVSPSAVDTRPVDPKSVPTSGKGSRLRAEDVAESVLHALRLPPRALVREIELWATNP
jgi:3-oxoacyl-[acyl-carrier protein] reductase